MDNGNPRLLVKDILLELKGGSIALATLVELSNIEKNSFTTIICIAATSSFDGLTINTSFTLP